jgi:hypothetical protein
MQRTLYGLVKGSGFFLLVVGLGAASAIAHEVNMPGQTGGGRIPVAQEESTVPICPISGPRGTWNDYEMHDLPRGQCSGAQACTLWTRDSCPGNDSPGPGIKWKCVCEAGMWRCEELERTKTVCVSR